VTRARLPAEKANTKQILKMCDAFKSVGCDLKLIGSNRRNRLDIDQSLKDFYELQHTVDPILLPSPDYEWLEKLSDYGWSWTRGAGFSISLLTYLVNQKISGTSRPLVYSRDLLSTFVLLLMKPVLSLDIFLEVHRVPASFQGQYKKIWRRANGFVVTTQQIKNRLVENDFDPESIHVAPDAVDLESFDIDETQTEARRKLDWPEDPTIATYLGRFLTMQKEKGIGTAIRSLQYLKERKSSLQFYFIGGPMDQVEQYQNLMQELGIGTDRVTFLDYQPTELVPTILKASDLLMMPYPKTEHYEYYMSPMKMFEYMASKRPIAATNLKSVREILTHGENALLAEPGNPESFAEQIEFVLDHPDQSRKLAEKAFETVKKYTWKNRAKHTKNFIQERLTFK
jgi:glycosyltransferase involved in cell wall biosynthesis